MSNSVGYREELRQSVKSFSVGHGSSGVAPGALPSSVNIYLFGPQGSGKTSFIRTCYRALYGSRWLEVNKGLEGLEQSLHRSDDGTSMYSVYSLTDRICIHDTRGQREYTPEEMQQLRLVLEGRARPNVLVQQRRRYWLLLREFWRSDEQMKRTFSRNVMVNKASVNTEPHFVFLVLDPNQQELLLEDADFRGCYGSLVSDFADRGVPHALLCTHGDTLTPQLRSALLRLPQELGCGGASKASAGPGGVLRPNGSGYGSGNYMAPPTAGPDSVLTPLPLWGSGGPQASMPGGPSAREAPKAPPPAPDPFEQQAPKAPPKEAARPQRMPDIMRIVTNYLGANERGQRPKAQPVELDRDGNDVQQDIHSLLVLLDALRQADNHVLQRVGGSRPAPMPAEAETGCPVL